MLSDRITRAPRPFDPEAGRAAADGLDGAAADLVAGMAGSSPYLCKLARREREWLREALDAPPEAALAALLEGEAGTLRRDKRRLHLLCALCDLGGAWTLEETTGALTAFADRAVDLALGEATARERARGKLSDGRRITAVAMGKMGAGELNYSSDIDLILLWGGTPADPSYAEDRAALIRAARGALRTLSDATAEGYVFRTDVRLRPDPSTTPLVIPFDAAERYYESLGRSWERAAHIKARACAGDVAAGEAYLGRLAPFVWRRSLDYATLQDVGGMLAKVRASRPSASLDGHDLKKGRGGIREIEFTAQALQLVHGGRDPGLRVRGTCEALDRLAAAGRIGPEEAAALKEDYRFLRDAEHRLQMVQDAQTHALPRAPEEWGRQAALHGTDVAGLRARIGDTLERVHRVASALFGPEEAPAPPPRAAAALARWEGYPALRSARARGGLSRIAGPLMDRLDAAPDPEAALLAFEGFLSRLPAGAQLFALFEANPALMDLVAEIAGAGPELAGFLAGNADVLDGIAAGDVFGPFPDAAALAGEAARAAHGDYEEALIGLRRWKAERHFGIGVNLLRGLSPAEAGARYAALAEAVLGETLPLAAADVVRRHGEVPGRGAALLAMGSLGGGRIDAGSDLDLIVIFEGTGESDGRRPLPARQWHARLTQTLLQALGAPMKHGRLYEADTRLRPSGRQGPVATSLEGFARYQREEAWTWERMALLRARPVAGPAPLQDALGAEVAAILAPGLPAGTVGEALGDMRRRLFAARPGGDPWALRDGPGGLQDLELAAQGCALAGVPAPGAVEEGVALLRDLKAILSLLAPAGGRPEALGAGGVRRLCEVGGAPDLAALTERLRRAREGGAEAVGALLSGTLRPG
ncbi:glutamate-ammonia-ligase adenylyltransferase [Hasllibacter halocynthiae]|uniref:Glutamate-ammonia-ligase adenylyltransferase n=1 Tax=Hasllibacter halocynthiae TaxID=595589 RepID=A0A2T0X985_9RHOB|nr:glutamine-synthetase adenylyltransferase [Hasllibacter halocynthiae]PRY95487.1 glutamate-ammonia-ligase adenylyltransferase [Hasllibacter halocynthiae]